MSWSPWQLAVSSNDKFQFTLLNRRRSAEFLVSSVAFRTSSQPWTPRQHRLVPSREWLSDPPASWIVFGSKLPICLYLSWVSRGQVCQICLPSSRTPFTEPYLWSQAGSLHLMLARDCSISNSRSKASCVSIFKFEISNGRTADFVYSIVQIPDDSTHFFPGFLR